jgi:hypothetical protein
MEGKDVQLAIGIALIATAVTGFLLALPRAGRLVLKNDYVQAVSMALIIAALCVGLANVVSGASTLLASLVVV